MFQDQICWIEFCEKVEALGLCFENFLQKWKVKKEKLRRDEYSPNRQVIDDLHVPDISAVTSCNFQHWSCNMLALKGRAQMDHQALKVTKDNRACQEMMDLREPKEKKVNNVLIVHHPLEGPQGTLALLAVLVKMDLLDRQVQLDLKVILALLEVMDQVEILEIR